MVALTQHFDKVIELYANEHAVDGGSNNGRTPNGRNNSGDRSPNVGQLLHHSERNMDVTKRKKPVFLHSSTVGTKELDSLVEAASKGKQTKDDQGFTAKAGLASNGKRPIPKREQYEDNHSMGSEYLILPEYQSEEIYSEVLHTLFNYNESLANVLTLWREHVMFLEKFATVVH